MISGLDPVRSDRSSARRKLSGVAGPLLLLVFFYVSALVVLMPMRVIVGVLPFPPAVELHGVDDAAWAGTVQALLVAGKHLGSLDYEMSPWSLLLGEIQYSLVLHTGAGRVDAIVNRSLWTGAVSLRNVRGEVDAALFRDLLPVASVTRGELFVALDSMAVQLGEYLHVQGRVEWRDLVVGFDDAIRFGTVDFELRPENAGTLVELASRDGEVLATGNVFIDAEGGFESRIELQAGDALTVAGRGLLNLVGSVDDGAILKHAGTLF